MTLQRVMAALATRYPSEDRMVPDLDRITTLLDLMGEPQRAQPSAPAEAPSPAPTQESPPRPGPATVPRNGKP